jgi:glycerol-3-phosphate dehydrogenase subunit B
MKHDVVVIGAGLAGLTAAVRLAENGRSVLVLAKGVGATHLAPPTIDVLGYSDDGEVVESPRRALSAVAARAPGHPYARVGMETVATALDWWKGAFPELRYTGGVDTNLLLPTAVGAAKPTAISPGTMAGGDLRSGGRMAIVGLRGLRDFHARYAADNLAQAARALGAEVVVRPLELKPPLNGQRDLGGLGFAASFERAEFRDAVVGELRTLLAPGERAGLPAVLGLRDADPVHRELEERLRTTVFEIPMLPPSVPGMRLFEVLKDALRRGGGRLVLGDRVLGAETNDRGVEAVVAETAARRVAYRARNFVLATGGFASGGFELDSAGTVRESVLGLPVAGVPPPGEPRFLPGYFDRHPLARAGLEVDERMRPLGPNGPVHANLYAAGAALAGAEPWREASGNGISVATGFAAAQAILEEGDVSRDR